MMLGVACSTPIGGGSKVHMAVDVRCEPVQHGTGNTVKPAWADQGYMGEQAKGDAAVYGIELQVSKLAQARKGFVLLPRRRALERPP